VRFNRSRLGEQIGFASDRVHGHGVVLLNNEPLPVRLAQHIGDTHNHMRLGPPSSETWYPFGLARETLVHTLMRIDFLS